MADQHTEIFTAEAGVKIVQREEGGDYELVMPSGNRNIWFTDREAAIYCAQVVGSCWLEAEACGAMEERAAAQPQWQPIDTAPKGVTVAVCEPDTGHSATAFLTTGNWIQAGPNGAVGLWFTPTHWMPLPAAPTTSNPGEPE